MKQTKPFIVGVIPPVLAASAVMDVKMASSEAGHTSIDFTLPDQYDKL